MKFHILRVERLKTMAEVKRSGLHTFREIPTENAISELLEKNETPNIKSGEDVYQGVFDRIKELDNKDKQACRCFEFFVSASPEQFKENGNLHDPDDQKRYFDSALDFIKKKHGEENVVGHVIHRDEKTPHMVVYAVPVVHREAKKRKRSVGVKGGGREIKEYDVPARSELSAKAYYHCPASLALLQDEFHAGVSKNFGLDRGVSRVDALKHKKSAVYYAEKNAELDAKLAEVALKEEDVVANFAKINRHREIFEGDKSRLSTDMEKLADDEAAVADKTVKLVDDLAKLTAKSEKLSAELVKFEADKELERVERLKLVDRETAVSGREAAVVLSQTELVDGFKKLESAKAEHLGFVNRIKIKQDQREQELSGKEKVVQEKEAAVDQRAINLTEFSKNQTAALDQRKVEMDQRSSEQDDYKMRMAKTINDFVGKTRGFSPEQIVAAIKQNIVDKVKPDMVLPQGRKR